MLQLLVRIVLLFFGNVVASSEDRNIKLNQLFEQLKKLKGLVSSRQKLAERLTEGLTGLPGLRLPVIKDHCTHVYYAYPLVLDIQLLGCDRSVIAKALQAEGVAVSPKYQNIHLLPMYQKKMAYGSKGFPWTSEICRRDVNYDKGICPVAEELNDVSYLGFGMCVYDLNDSDIDLIIVSTGTPDNVYPSTACLLQHRLGNKKAVAFDIQAACSGSIFSLDIANQYIKSGAAKTVLIVGAEICSRIVDWTDRGTCILFGDGAAAMLLQASEEAGVLSTHIHSDGGFEELLKCPNPQAASDKTAEQGYISMKGNEVFKVAVNTLGKIVDETLIANNLDKSAIDWLVPHQANSRIIAATAKKLKMSMEQVVLTLEEQGNTSSASVLLAFNTAVRDGRIQRGQLVLLEAFGAGFTWGSALIKY